MHCLSSLTDWKISKRSLSAKPAKLGHQGMIATLGETTHKGPGDLHVKAEKRGKPRKSRVSRAFQKVLSGSASRYGPLFAEYPDFKYNPANSVVTEFWRMCSFYKWKKEDSKRKNAHEAFKNALVQTFNNMYGTDENDIESWRRLYRVLKITPIPNKLEECRSAVLAIHINMVDLVDNDYKRVHIFPNIEELRQYTRRTGKYFPKDHAYAGGVLKYLLREITSTYSGDREHSRLVNIRSTADAALRKPGRQKK